MSLSDVDYHAKSHALLARIEAQVDAWLDEDLVDIDSHRAPVAITSSGMAPSGSTAKARSSTLGCRAARASRQARR
jgi:hypothetical protein